MEGPRRPYSPTLQRFLKTQASGRRVTSPYTSADRLTMLNGSPHRYSEAPIPKTTGPDYDVTGRSAAAKNHNRFIKYSPSSLAPTLPTTAEEGTDSTGPYHLGSNRRPSRVSDFPLPPEIDALNGVHERGRRDVEYEQRHRLPPSDWRRPSASPPEGHRPSAYPREGRRPSANPSEGRRSSTSDIGQQQSSEGYLPNLARQNGGHTQTGSNFGGRHKSIDTIQLPKEGKNTDNKDTLGTTDLFDNARKQSICMPVSSDGPHAIVDVVKVKEEQKKHKDFVEGKKRSYCCKAFALLLFVAMLSVVPYAIYNYLLHKDMLKPVKELVSESNKTHTTLHNFAATTLVSTSVLQGQATLSTGQNVTFTAKSAESTSISNSGTVSVPGQITKPCANGEKFYRAGCTSSYFVCDNGVPVSRHCNWMLVLDVRKEKCVLKSSIPDCSST